MWCDQKCNMHQIRENMEFHEKTVLCGLLRKRVWGVARNQSQVQQPRVPRKNEKTIKTKQQKNKVSPEPKRQNGHMKPDKIRNVKVYAHFIFYIS